LPAGEPRHLVVHGAQVLHLRQLGLRDLDPVALLDPRQDLDGAERVRLVLVDEVGRVGDLVGVELQVPAHDLSEHLHPPVYDDAHDAAPSGRLPGSGPPARSERTARGRMTAIIDPILASRRSPTRISPSTKTLSPATWSIRATWRRTSPGNARSWITQSRT